MRIRLIISVSGCQLKNDFAFRNELHNGEKKRIQDLCGFFGNERRFFLKLEKKERKEKRKKSRSLELYPNHKKVMDFWTKDDYILLIPIYHNNTKYKIIVKTI